MAFLEVWIPVYQVNEVRPRFPSNDGFVDISCCPKPVNTDNGVVDFKSPKTQVSREKSKFAPGIWRGRTFAKL